MKILLFISISLFGLIVFLKAETKMTTYQSTIK